jgi:hypothetical protein
MIVMNYTATTQAHKITHKIRAVVQKLNEDRIWEPPSSSGPGRWIAGHDAGRYDREEHQQNGVESAGHAMNSRIMARPPPGARANLLALWR